MRAYYVTTEYSEGGVGIIADSAKEAKAIAFGHECFGDDAEWIDLRVKWKRNVNVTGLPKGEIDLMEGLLRGLYGYIYGAGSCPVCEDGCDYGNPLVYDSGIVRCQACEEKAEIL